MYAKANTTGAKSGKMCKMRQTRLDTNFGRLYFRTCPFKVHMTLKISHFKNMLI